jgi:NADH dehydrogenase/NADH:ubiquinone oxidoreductase subunit G
MVEIVLNGKSIKVEEEISVLEISRREGITIPTLCYHEALGPYGACRLCIVEAEGPFIRRSLMTSCNLIVSNGLKIETESNLVMKSRKVIFELLIARCPDSSLLRKMAEKYGVYSTRFKNDRIDDCVRCGLCVRVCRDKIGLSAITFAYRGQNRSVTAEFGDLSDLCIGCASCANICPTGAIRVTDRGSIRTVSLWDNIISRLELMKCEGCGKFFITKKHFEYISSKLAESGGIIKNLCSECARLYYTTSLTGQFPPY